MTLSEKDISFLEKQIPHLAKNAFEQAYWQALASGSSVLESENGYLVEVYPDGTRKQIKKLKKHINTTIGQRLEIL